MSEKKRILLVEDDENLGFLMADFLLAKGFIPTLSKDGISGLNTFLRGTYDFAILDVMLPGMDGFTLAKKIKERSPGLPVIFVTARTMKEDKIKGFNLGVDDYITKPFDQDELYCRIQAILNRIPEKIVPPIDKYQIGNYTFEPNNQSLTLGKDCLRLTQRENEVLKLLIESSGKIVKRDLILKSIWGSNDYFVGRSLDVYVSKLRKYLQGDPDVTIESIPKVGFVISWKNS